MTRIVARGLEEADLPKRVRWFNASATQSQVFLDVPFSLAGTQEWFRRNLLNERRRDFAFDLVTDEGEAQLVGMGGFVDIDVRNRKAERYFLLDPETTGHGLGPAMLHWLCNYGYVYLNLNRIYGFSIEGNERILRVNQREGWVLEGTLRGSIHYKGRYLDQHVKSLLRSEWEKQPWMSVDVGFEIEL
jgi:RimJ/RimL family protein N-acetyltransferase